MNWVPPGRLAPVVPVAAVEPGMAALDRGLSRRPGAGGHVLALAAVDHRDGAVARRDQDGVVDGLLRGVHPSLGGVDERLLLVESVRSVGRAAGQPVLGRDDGLLGVGDLERPAAASTFFFSFAATTAVSSATTRCSAAVTAACAVITWVQAVVETVLGVLPSWLFELASVCAAPADHRLIAAAPAEPSRLRHCQLSRWRLSRPDTALSASSGHRLPGPWRPRRCGARPWPARSPPCRPWRSPPPAPWWRRRRSALVRRCSRRHSPWLPPRASPDRPAGAQVRLGLLQGVLGLPAVDLGQHVTGLDVIAHLHLDRGEPAPGGEAEVLAADSGERAAPGDSSRDVGPADRRRPSHSRGLGPRARRQDDEHDRRPHHGDAKARPSASKRHQHP